VSYGRKTLLRNSKVGATVQYRLVESINVAVASNVTTAIYGLNYSGGEARSAVDSHRLFNGARRVVVC